MAYLNLVLSDNEVIYLEQPPEFLASDSKKYVFRLHKALYGLKQGARSWYESLREALGQLEFVRTETDHGVFVKKWAEGELVILAVHVDDCLSIGSLQDLINESKQKINGKYKLTDLGPC